MESRIEQVVREWKQWSRSELRNIKSIVDEILDHCRNGNGNRFVSDWCRKNLSEVFSK